MKRALLCILIMFSVPLVFAETVTLRTGDFFALSVADYFFPVDINVTGSKCSVTGIKNIEKDLWCVSISTNRTGSSMPIVYDYYVRQGDVIRMRRIRAPMEECGLRVISIKWNEVVLGIQ